MAVRKVDIAPQAGQRPTAPERGNKARNMLRKLTPLVAVAFGVVIALRFPQISVTVRSIFSDVASTHAPEEQVPEAAPDGLVKLTAEQIGAANIEMGSAGPGTLARRITVPAAVRPDPDRVGHVAAKVAGTVAELRKKLGDRVDLNEVIAIVDSREVADAKSAYLAAAVQYDLQNQLFQREKGLFEKKITAEQLFLKAKTSRAQARLALDLARQKLATLDLSDQEIANLASQPIAGLQRKEIRAPLAGRIIERLVNLGQPVGGEGQAKELYVISDLSVVEADLAVPAKYLAAVREGQPVSLTTATSRVFEGKVAVVDAMITQETRSGRVIARFENRDLELRPGSLFNARIALAETRVKVRVPRTAVQTVGGEPAVFVRTDDGFIKRKVETGAADHKFVEILAGLAPGEQIATTNAFILKAELGKKDFDPGL